MERNELARLAAIATVFAVSAAFSFTGLLAAGLAVHAFTVLKAAAAKSTAVAALELAAVAFGFISAAVCVAVMAAGALIDARRTA